MAAQLRRDTADPLTDAIMLTTVGYTAGALDVARDEGLILATLTTPDVVPVTDAPVIHFRGEMRVPSDPEVTGLIWADDAELERARQALGAGTTLRFRSAGDEPLFYDADGGVVATAEEVFEPLINQGDLELGVNDREHLLDEPAYVELAAGVRVRVRGLRYRVELLGGGVHEFTVDLNRRANEIAELVLRGVEGTLKTSIVTAVALRGLERAPDGEIRPRRP